MDDIKKMKVDQLRKDLRLRGLSRRGLKSELIERLNKAPLVEPDRARDQRTRHGTADDRDA